ncbi:MAG: RsmB/NOP family class I SAM-dependent RNA methyltransferase [Clostridia bacterium]|nr:RsmB/NOP family class I SAM-dependent RNA methyltransferase [Clostridia bacterium]
MQEQIPNFLVEKLKKQYGEEETKKIIEGYSKKRPVTLRVNLLKVTTKQIEEQLKKEEIVYQKVSWSSEAYILENVTEKKIRTLNIYENGEIYLQSLSSMLPAIVLNPKPEENILDMAAAPGGKTTQLAALSQNKSLITACEKNKIRAERLKYNVEKQGANKVNVLIEDARNLSNYFSFDKILLDSPCSGSGTINLENQKFFTQELVTRSIKTQKQLLQKAISILKPGSQMVYSTCSILQEENEEQLKELISKKKVEIIPIDKKLFEGVPMLPTKIEGTLCVCPTNLYEGFFVAILRKEKKDNGNYI